MPGRRTEARKTAVGIAIFEAIPTTAGKERQMPKMKTKSSVKKRFRLTATGKVRRLQAGKRHGMIKRSTKQIREHRGSVIMAASNAKVVKKFMPYG
jgi:large subunit ribosomal protein L35